MKKQEVENVIVSMGSPAVDLLSRIKDLSPVKTVTSVDIVSSKKKQKKKKKKEKDDSTSSELFPDGKQSDIDGGSDGIGQYTDLDSLIDELISDEDGDEDDEDFDNGIILGQKNAYGARKKGDSEYKKEFNEEYTLLYSLLEELNKLSKSSEKQLKTFEQSRARGSSKYSNDLLNNIIGLKTNKLQVIKELASIKKTIADLEIKKNGKGGGAIEGGFTMDDVSSMYLSQIMSNGRSQFIDAIGGGSSRNISDDDDEFDDIISNSMSNHFDEERNDKLNDVLEDRLRRDGNDERSDDGTEYIRHEHEGCKIEVKRNIENGDWKFIAINRDGLEVPSYPVPSVDDVGRMVFNEQFAKDRFGRMYNLNEVYSDLY